MTYDVFKVVNWLRFKNTAELNSDDENAEELTQMKAMKLLYYIQAASLVVTGKRMFDEDILAWKYGPVVKKVHDKYKGVRGIVGDITEDPEAEKDYKELESDPQTADILNSVYEIYGHSSAHDLMVQTHKEAPWQETKQNGVISDSKIREYYSQFFVAQ